MAVPIMIVMETTDLDPVTLTSGKIILGTAELETTAGWGLTLIPAILRDIADGLEDGMTTGPDEAAWLGTPSEPS